VSQPLVAFPQAQFDRLPTVAFVVPSLQNDMHDGSVAAGDAWLRKHIAAYAHWAQEHDALLILTWDEDDGTPTNRIPTLFSGARVKPGSYGSTINHYSVLRTVEDLFGLPHLGEAARAPAAAPW
jgi:acid phosphatase